MQDVTFVEEKQQKLIICIVRRRKQIISDYESGLYTLHAWIKCMECVLHLAYSLEFHKWSTATKEHEGLMIISKRKNLQEV